MQQQSISIEQQLDNIFASDALSEQDKTVAIQKLHKQAVQLDNTKLFPQINVKTWKIIIKNLDQCSVDTRRALLTFAEFLTECGACSKQINNLFLFDFRSSSFLQKIESLLNKNIGEKDDNNQNQKSYSELTIQLAHIYMLMTKGCDIKQDLLHQCTKIISSCILSLINKLQQINSEHISAKMKEQKFDIENNPDIRIGTKIIKAVKEISLNNRVYFVEQAKLHEIIAPLIHINCSSKLECIHRLVIPHSQIITELQENVYKIIYQLIYEDELQFKFLIDKHDIIIHLASIFQKQTYNSSIQIQLLDQQSNFPNESSLMDLYITTSDLLWLIVFHNFTSFDRLIASTNLFSQIITLTKFRRQVHISQEYDESTLRIRQKSIINFEYIQQRLLQLRNEQYLKPGYIIALIEAVSLGGGCEEQNNQIIKYSLNNTQNYISKVRINNQQDNNLSLVLKQAEEEIEQQAGMEEIQAHSFQQNIQVDQFKDYAYSLLETIFNSFKNRRN